MGIVVMSIDKYWLFVTFSPRIEYNDSFSVYTVSRLSFIGSPLGSNYILFLILENECLNMEDFHLSLRYH